jgi:tricarballylate dehydrogenase
MNSGANDFDVIVVGCGIAGLSAAVSAQQAGARVALLERTVMEERGGNTRYTESFWRMKSHDEVSDDFEEHLAANAGGYLDPEIIRDAGLPYDQWPPLLKGLGFTDPEVIATLAENAGPTLNWLSSFGVKFDFLPNYFITQSTTRIAPAGGGLALVEALASYAESVSDDITIFYRTTARELILSENNAVTGLRAIDSDNCRVSFNAPAVILASGGFEGNPEMQSRYFGPASQFIRPVARGGYFNRGEGVQMGLDAGAAPCGDFGSFHAQPVDPRSGQHEPVILNFPYGILVNNRARRFTDEAPVTVDACYEAITREIMNQPKGIAYTICDAGLDDVPNWQKSVRTDQPPIEADDVPSLAAALGVESAVLEQTISAYNAACPSGGEFKALELDDLATQGLDPVKSNWARPLARPPYRAWPVIAANCFTFGGLKADYRARVVNSEGATIAGLYAAGETAGLYYRSYTGATSVMRGAVFGRIAGRDAAELTRGQER